MDIKAGKFVVTGQLRAWAGAADGTWLGLVEFVLTTGIQQGRVRVRQLVPGRALRAAR
ncbi:hypothetical protein [Nocardia veterana]|uniref:Uncharacterized protein n=1 Tax=Nocardia veterana TaxID=132249 RepID=A0A7X6M136_9NOCA|nr:hypothetical protein [Nocardia veterana]NKY88316.1 hypothetical protein [Nocardia veterana]